MELKTAELERAALNSGLTALVAIAAALIILANGLLCAFLLRDRRLWKIRMNKIMFSLAIADFLVGIILIPQAAHEAYIDDKPFDTTVCRLLNATTWLSITTSIYTFTVISILRLLFHNHPTFYSDHFESRVVKSEFRMPWMTMSVLLPWLMGLLQE